MDKGSDEFRVPLTTTALHVNLKMAKPSWCSKLPSTPLSSLFHRFCITLLTNNAADESASTLTYEEHTERPVVGVADTVIGVGAVMVCKEGG